MTMNRTFRYDAELLLHDGAAAVTADSRGQVSSSNKVVDLGGAANMSGTMVLQVTAIDVANSDESYEIHLQGSETSDFSGDIETLARIKLGALETLGVASIGVATRDSAVGTHLCPFYNYVMSTDGTTDEAKNYRYVRAVIDVTGTTPSITCQIYLSDIRD